MVTPLATVSILLVNFNGREHLGPCLESIAALDYPADLVETILVDNASSDGSLDLLASTYPWVKVLAQDCNLGFAPAVNLAAASGSGDVIALINNDMRVEPGWLRALVALHDPAAGFVCVAGTILDWEGEHLDFGGATINFHGFGHQPGFGTPIADAHIEDGVTLAFACGGSMIVSRDVFVALGGFDPEFFAYFEDVDFGWRLQVCGYRTRLAAGARSFHRHHGTSARFRIHERILLLERNALRVLIKNVSDENLAAVLAAALLLAAERARHDARSNRALFDMGAAADELETVHRLGNSRMHAIADVVADLPDLMLLRADIQRRRQVSDSAVFATFGEPFEALGNDAPEYVAAMGNVARLLGIGALFIDAPVSRVVVVAAGDVIAERMAGTAIRAWELACALSQHARVTVASPRTVTRAHPGVEIVEFTDADVLRATVDAADVVVVFGFDLQRYPFLAHTRALVVVDLYDPWIFGSLEQYDTMAVAEADGQKAHEINTLNQLMDVGDFFICASERQRDFWVGMLASRGRLDKAAHEQHPNLRALIDVVPFGVPELPPQRAITPVLRGGQYPGIDADSLIILWGGGTWDWFDPVGLLEAFVRVHHEVPTARLFFMGLELEGRGVPEMSTTRRLVERIAELDLVERGLVAVGPWVPYDERGQYLLEADVGVVAAKDLAESRLAFRTRMVDHFWAGLPTLATRGDVLADVVAAEGAGMTVAPNDVDAMVVALTVMLSDHERRRAYGDAAAGLADRFRWSGVVQPLVMMLLEPGPWRAGRARRHRDSGGRTTAGLWGPESPGASMVSAPASDVTTYASTVPGALDQSGTSLAEPLSAELLPDEPRSAKSTAAESPQLDLLAELVELRAHLATSEAHLHAARRKLDWFSRTPVYPLYRALRRMIGSS